MKNTLIAIKCRHAPWQKSRGALSVRERYETFKALIIEIITAFCLNHRDRNGSSGRDASFSVIVAKIHYHSVIKTGKKMCIYNNKKHFKRTLLFISRNQRFFIFGKWCGLIKIMKTRSGLNLDRVYCFSRYLNLTGLKSFISSRNVTMSFIFLTGIYIRLDILIVCVMLCIDSIRR